jgi:hypothetical protein
MSKFRTSQRSKICSNSCASAIGEPDTAFCDEKATVGSPECAVTAVIQRIKSGNHDPCPVTAKIIPRGAP